MVKIEEQHFVIFVMENW